MEIAQKPVSEDIQALQQILAIMAPLDEDQRRRVFSSISTFFGIGHPAPIQRLDATKPASSALGKFSDHPEIGPKEFMLQKEPRTDIERVACLAYYLTHFRATPHFKTLDISKLNAEAAQLKLSNAAMAVENATKRGLLVSSMKGNKQMSAIGEMYVRELPDREAANNVFQKHGPRRSASKVRKQNGSPDVANSSDTNTDATE